MKLRFTPSTLEKIEKIISEAGYILRYERGTFQSGYCILESKKVVVLNKFLQTEGRINTLIDLLSVLQIEADHISIESRKLFEELTTKPEVNQEAAA
ncbi:MAG: hypothetical protein RJB03_1254 [Bacteroidota bacterium]|jgi:hypothetical protein|nr:hypothetical protein [Chitinophagia bacterium]